MQLEKKLANLNIVAMKAKHHYTYMEQHSSMAVSVNKQRSRTLDTPVSNVGCSVLQRPTQANSIIT